MNRPRTSIIWKVSEDTFKQYVAESNTMRQLLAKFGFENKGGNYRTAKKRIEELGLNIDHFKWGAYAFHSDRPKMTVNKFKSEHLIDNSTNSTSFIKKYLKRFSLIDFVCVECGTCEEWNGKPLSLQLDHINGRSNDNRLENLRMICPNCHSQTDTFAGKNNKGSKKRWMPPSDSN